MMATQNTYSPRIYVASLSDYNAGILHGAWIDATDVDGMREAIADMLRESKYPNVEVEDNNGNMVPSAEEWAIHDYDDFAGLKMGEYEDLDRIAAIAELLEEHGEPFAVWYEYMDGANLDADELGDKFQDQYLGEYSNAAEYVQEYVESTGMLADVPDTIARYFDYEAFGRDLEMGGDIFIHNGYAFDNNA